MTHLPVPLSVPVLGECNRSRRLLAALSAYPAIGGLMLRGDEIESIGQDWGYACGIAYMSALMQFAIP